MHTDTREAHNDKMPNGVLTRSILGATFQSGEFLRLPAADVLKAGLRRQQRDARSKHDSRHERHGAEQRLQQAASGFREPHQA